MKKRERRALDEKIALGCRILGGEGLTRAAYGHVSARLDDGTIAIKARGPDEESLEFTTARDIITIDANGVAIDPPPGLVTPNEAQIHTEIYKVRPDVGSVLHIHPPIVVALAATGRKLLPLYGAFAPAGLRLATGSLRYYPKSLLIATPELGKEVAEVLGDGEACVLRGHGIVAVGPTVEAAVLCAIALGELAQVNWLAASAGEPQPLDQSDLDAWTAFFEKYPSGVFKGRSDSGEPAEWYSYKKRDAKRFKAT